MALPNTLVDRHSHCIQDRFEDHLTFQAEEATDHHQVDLLHQEEEEEADHHQEEEEEHGDHHLEDQGVHHNQEQHSGRQVALAGKGESG